MNELETISIAEPLQNRQHVLTPYLGQIWHATVGQWCMLTGVSEWVSSFLTAHQHVIDYSVLESCLNVKLCTQ